MEHIVTWMKEFLIVYLILTILTNLAATDQYKKHLHFFSGVILLLAFISPVLGLFGKAGRLEALISYESFWEKLDSARQDTQKLEFLQNSHYISKYEQAVAADMKRQAQDLQIPVRQIQVRLSDAYEIMQVTVWMDISQEDAGEAEKNDRKEKMLQYLMHTYDLQENQIYIG